MRQASQLRMLSKCFFVIFTTVITLLIIIVAVLIYLFIRLHSVHHLHHISVVCSTKPLFRHPCMFVKPLLWPWHITGSVFREQAGQQEWEKESIKNLGGNRVEKRLQRLKVNVKILNWKTTRTGKKRVCFVSPVLLLGHAYTIRPLNWKQTFCTHDPPVDYMHYLHYFHCLFLPALCQHFPHSLSVYSTTCCCYVCTKSLNQIPSK